VTGHCKPTDAYPNNGRTCAALPLASLPFAPSIAAAWVCLLTQLWEQLLFDSSIKERLLSYATSALLFADRGVAPAVVGINRVALLHGCAFQPALPAPASRLIACSSYTPWRALPASGVTRAGYQLSPAPWPWP